MRHSKLIAAVVFALVLSVSTPVLAETGLGGGNTSGTGLEGGNTSGTGLGGGNGGGLDNPLGNTSTLDGLLGKVLDAIIAIGVVVVTVMLVYCGFLFVVAQGNEEKIRSARSALMWTIIGAVILLGARVISGVISTTVQSL